MKKKVFIIALVCAVTASAAVIFSQEKSQISELTEANIEALAGVRVTPVIKCTGPKIVASEGADTGNGTVSTICRCKNSVPCMDNTGCNF